MSKYDNQFRIQKDAQGNVINEFNYPAYFKNVPAEKLPADGENTTIDA